MNDSTLPERLASAAVEMVKGEDDTTEVLLPIASEMGVTDGDWKDANWKARASETASAADETIG